MWGKKGREHSFNSNHVRGWAGILELRLVDCVWSDKRRKGERWNDVFKRSLKIFHNSAIGKSWSSESCCHCCDRKSLLWDIRRSCPYLLFEVTQWALDVLFFASLLAWFPSYCEWTHREFPRFFPMVWSGPPKKTPLLQQSYISFDKEDEEALKEEAEKTNFLCMLSKFLLLLEQHLPRFSWSLQLRWSRENQENQYRRPKDKQQQQQHQHSFPIHFRKRMGDRRNKSKFLISFPWTRAPLSLLIHR